MRSDEEFNKKLNFLYKNNIIKDDKKISKSSVNRLYSFYQRNPLSTPILEAYGMKKSIRRSVDRFGGDYILSTPKGKISAEKYIKSESRRLVYRTRRQISPQAGFKANVYRKYIDRIQDFLSYRYSISCNQGNYDKVLSYIERHVLPVIRSDVDLVASNFKRFYSTPMVGSVAGFRSKDFPMGEGEFFSRVAFTRLYRDRRYERYLDFFINSLFDSLKGGFLLVHRYNNFDITLYKIEIVFTSDIRSSNYEKLRR